MDSNAIHMYAPGMRRYSFLLVVFCLHCGGQTQTGPADETPAATEAPGAASGGESATPAASDTEASKTETEASKTEASKPEPGALKDTSPPPGTPCAKLAKSDCKVRKGCAWNDKGKCVDE
jgi:hypothetical protein